MSAGNRIAASKIARRRESGRLEVESGRPRGLSFSAPGEGGAGGPAVGATGDIRQAWGDFVRAARRLGRGGLLASEAGRSFVPSSRSISPRARATRLLIVPTGQPQIAA